MPTIGLSLDWRAITILPLQETTYAMTTVTLGPGRFSSSLTHRSVHTSVIKLRSAVISSGSISAVVGKWNASMAPPAVKVPADIFQA